MKAFAILLMITVKTVLGAPINPDENRDIEDPDLFEGDMYLTPEQRGYAMMGLDVFTSNRQGASIKGPLWPGGVVVYDIAPALAREPKAYTAILAGMDEWVRKTCISFKKRTTETDYAYFTDAGSGCPLSFRVNTGIARVEASVAGKKTRELAVLLSVSREPRPRPMRGCSSRVGKVGSRQDIILSSRCWYKGTVIHEIGHAIGFFHEQSRPDRDTYITILTENIQAGKEHNFRKYDRSLIDSLGTPYDYRSVMHYSAKAFTKNGLPTLMVKQEGFQNVIGQRNGLSAIDADQAKKLYRCGGRLGRCNLPRETGFCRAAFTRYYYNTSSGNCESFIWGGCGGNANNFNTLDECKKACMPSGGAVNTMAPPVTTGHPTTQSNQHGTIKRKKKKKRRISCCIN